MRPLAMETPGWLTALRHAVALIVATLAVCVPMMPGLMPWVAAAFLPMTVGYALVIGLPLALIMRARGWAGPLHAMGAGALAGAVPAGLFAMITAGPGGLVFMSAVGFAIGLVAWIAAQLQALPDRLLRGRRMVLAGAATSLLFLVVAVYGTLAGLQAMRGPPDLSCHNVMRDGRRSISPVAGATLDITPVDWPRLRALLAEAGAAGNWSVRDLSRSREGFRRVSVSLCQEPGTNLNADHLLFDGQRDAIPGVYIGVYQPQGGDSWVQPARIVYRRVSLAWPGKLAFKNSGGQRIDAPDWYCESEADLPTDTLLCPQVAAVPSARLD